MPSIRKQKTKHMQTLSQFLCKEGFEVTSAVGGSQGLKVIVDTSTAFKLVYKLFI